MSCWTDARDLRKGTLAGIKWTVSSLKKRLSDYYANKMLFLPMPDMRNCMRKMCGM